MAISRNTLFDKLSSAESKGTQWSTGVTFNRTNPVPIDKSGYFQTFNDLSAYAAATTNTVAFPGQVLTLVEANSVKLYKINVDGTVTQIDAALTPSDIPLTAANGLSLDNGYIGIKIGDGLELDEDGKLTAQKLSFDAAPTADSQNVVSSGGIYSFGETLSGAAVAAANSSLSIHLSSTESEEAGVLRTYTLTQGGELIGTINIPKDFLVKSAELCTVATADVPYTGAEVGDKYIDFTVNTKDDDETASHVYLPVKDLVDVYTGADTDTISVTVGNDNSISAIVRSGSITSTELANNAVTTDKILSSAVTTNKIADNAVTTDKILSSAVTTDKIADGNITLAKLSTDVTDYIDGVGTAANGYTDTAIEGLTASFTGSTSKTITAMSQADGVVSLTANDIQIVAAQVSDFNTAVNGIVGNYVPLSVAETATDSDKLWTKTKVEAAINSAVDALDYTEQTVPAGQTISAISETNGVIAVRTGAISINTNQITDIDSKLANYVKTEVVDGTPTVDDKIQTKSKVTAAINTALSGLDVDTVTVGANKTIASIGETDGKISVVTADIEIAASQVSDFNTAVNGIVGNYVPLSVASSSASSSDKLQTASEVSAIAQSYINTLDVVEQTIAASKTITKISETDGKISVTTSDISIAQSQVNGLTADLTAINSSLTNLRNNKLDASAFATLSNTIGLSAASADDKVVTFSQISSIASEGMHFKGVITKTSDEETDAAAIARTQTDPTAGDIVMIAGSAIEYIYSGSEWIQLGDELAYVTKTTYNAKVGELEAADGILSTAIDNKIYIDGVKAETLSAFNVSQDEFYAKVNAGTILSNELYIVSSDYINAYDEQVKNVAEPILSNDAATKNYVDVAVAEAEAKTTALSGIALSGVTLNGTAVTVTSNVAALSIDGISGGNASA